jgi:hypothetical protein
VLVPEETAGYDWYNRIYTGDRFRRAHIEVVDKTQTSKILVLHCTIFPHYNDPSPIWGCDAVCGANKITGAFHDMSSGGDPNHVMMKWFAEQSAQLSWERPRELPEWARNTFSPAIIAAGNIRDEDQLEALGVVDIVIIPVGGGGYTLDPTAAADLVRQIDPKVVIPIHYADSALKYEVPQDSLQTFVGELGAPVETVAKYKLKSAAALPESLTIIEVTRS